MNTETTNANIPEVIKVPKEGVFDIPQIAEAVGIALYELGWPRRKVLNRLQLRLEYYLDAGGVYLDENGEPIAVDENTIEERFGNDPGFKWLSEFPKQCKETGLTNSPSVKVQRRLQILDLALRTPPLGLAI